MKITLAQSINLLSNLHKKASELQDECLDVSYIEIPKGTEYTPYETTVEEVLEDLTEVQNDILNLKEIIQEANLSNKIDWDGNSISVIRAIETAKQLRNRIYLLKQLASMKKREFDVQYHSGAIMERIALFEPAEYKKKVEKLSRQVELLSSRIDQVNYTVEIDVALAAKYLEA